MSSNLLPTPVQLQIPGTIGPHLSMQPDQSLAPSVSSAAAQATSDSPASSRPKAKAIAPRCSKQQCTTALAPSPPSPYLECLHLLAGRLLLRCAALELGLGQLYLGLQLVQLGDDLVALAHDELVLAVHCVPLLLVLLHELLGVSCIMVLSSSALTAVTPSPTAGPCSGPWLCSAHGEWPPNLGQRRQPGRGDGDLPSQLTLCWTVKHERFERGHSTPPREKSHEGPVPLDPDFSQPFTHTGSSTEDFTASALPKNNNNKKNPRILSFFHGQATLFL